MLKIEIDGKQTEVENGKTVMEAANALGIFIPHFCYHKKLSIAANCRMCLVQVEKAPKPLPACATPVTDGMKVQTHSDYAVNAQKGVMEFLLINHPLDCPICDQGGECQLQDLAVGYGSSASRYQEEKRVVFNKNLGPLISTDMTRCIHCTRCVRFGQEIAGIMELGMAGRGEHSEILSFVGKTVDSELSGNMIDLCPVGALTSKPFRYSARTWELSRRRSVSPHCGLGSNLAVQVKQDRVMRVLPLENDAINECWLSDKDRFAYEGLNSDERLQKPMLKQDGKWIEVDWQQALEYVANGLTQIVAEHGAGQIGALTTPHQTLEEMYLLQKILRGLGSDNVDHRLRQSDFALDSGREGAPWLGMAIADLSVLDSVVIIGSTLRKDHPLIANRLRQAVKRGLAVNIVNPVDDDWLMRVSGKAIVAPKQMGDMLAQILKALAKAKQAAVPPIAANAVVTDNARKIAASLIGKEKAAVLLGNLAQHSPDYSTLHHLAQQIADLSGAKFGVLGEAANSVGAYIAKAAPSGEGLNAAQMFEHPRKAYLLLGVEAELDCYNPLQAITALKSADMVVALSAFKHNALDYADVLLPISPFTETAGTFINTEGRAQSFNGVVKPLGDTRPAWKVFRVLGNLLNMNNFSFDSVETVRKEIGANLEAQIKASLNNRVDGTVAQIHSSSGDSIQRIGEVPIYATDAIVRRAPSLQKTADGKSAQFAGISAGLFDQLGLVEGADIRIRQGNAAVMLKAKRETGLAQNCVRVASGAPNTAILGAMFGDVVVEKISAERAA
ncbi:MAG: NADH-quinone oxidoreductase subunit NuoG [Burkholderiales bacterium]